MSEDGLIKLITNTDFRNTEEIVLTLGIAVEKYKDKIDDNLIINIVCEGHKISKDDYKYLSFKENDKEGYEIFIINLFLHTFHTLNYNDGFLKRIQILISNWKQKYIDIEGE